MKLTTEPVRRVLGRLGNPQDRLPPVIHIAGTNGKGSTTAFLRAIAEAHGKKVHVDTSPHIINVNERIRVAGELISDEQLWACLQAVLEANDGESLSFFEGMTIASFMAFADTPADLTLVEVGLGGRFDSTNVFKSPRVSVITPIDLDHKEFLGRHVAQIAWEKAGIIKPQCHVVSAAQQRDVRKTLLAEAAYRDAPISFLDDVLELSPGTCDGQSIRLAELTIRDTELGLMGDHQYQNASLALLALQTANLFDLDPDAIRRGLKAVSWPARLQKLDDGPLTRILSGKTVLLDGGHNPHAAAALAKSLAPQAPMPVIMAILATKDVQSFLAPMRDIAERLIAIPIPGKHNAHSPEAIAAYARNIGIDATTASDVMEAAKLAASSTCETALICGSLYLAGSVLAANDQSIN